MPNNCTKPCAEPLLQTASLQTPLQHHTATMRLAALVATAQALVAPTPQRTSTRLHGRANKLVIWDCDGVLVDSEALLKRAEVDALKAAGFDDVDEDACNRLFSGFAPEAVTDSRAPRWQLAPSCFRFKNAINKMHHAKRRTSPPSVHTKSRVCVHVISVYAWNIGVQCICMHINNIREY